MRYTDRTHKSSVSGQGESTRCFRGSEREILCLEVFYCLATNYCSKLFQSVVFLVGEKSICKQQFSLELFHILVVMVPRIPLCLPLNVFETTSCISTVQTWTCVELISNTNVGTLVFRLQGIYAILCITCPISSIVAIVFVCFCFSLGHRCFVCKETQSSQSQLR